MVGKMSLNFMVFLVSTVPPKDEIINHLDYKANFLFLQAKYDMIKNMLIAGTIQLITYRSNLKF
jgi:hypothetical protein